MKIAGIDFSSLAVDVVTVCLDDLTPPTWHRFPLAGQDAFDRTRSVAVSMPNRTSELWADVLAIGIEHPAGKFGTGPMMRVQGAVLSMLPAGVLVQPWPPSAWRKAVGLAGNATKGVVSSWVNHHRHGGTLSPSDPRLPPAWLDVHPWPQDACDAYCIALATRSALDHLPTERAA